MIADPWQLSADIVRVWVPFVSGFLALWKVYATGKARVTEWMDKLLDNHLAHVQASLENIDSAQAQQIELLKKIADK